MHPNSFLFDSAEKAANRCETSCWPLYVVVDANLFEATYFLNPFVSICAFSSIDPTFTIFSKIYPTNLLCTCIISTLISSIRSSNPPLANSPLSKNSSITNFSYTSALDVTIAVKKVAHLHHESHSLYIIQAHLSINCLNFYSCISRLNQQVPVIHNIRKMWMACLLPSNMTSSFPPHGGKIVFYCWVGSSEFNAIFDGIDIKWTTLRCSLL